MMGEIKKALEGVTPGPWFEGDKWVFVSPRSGLMNEALENVLRNDEAQANARYIAAVNPAAIAELISTLESLQRENEELREKTALHSADAKTAWAECDELRNLAERLKLEAQSHSMEAGTANSTINEIYQIISDGKGEPANYHGAEPVREYVKAAKGEILRLETELALSKPVYSRRQLEDRAEAAEAEVKREAELATHMAADCNDAQARVKVLEAALKPFAEEAEKWHEMWPDDHIPAVHPKGNVCASCGAEPDCDVARFTVGDFRRARTALASTGGEHNAE